MEYISSDTNVWLDFSTISKIELPFRFPCVYVMYHEALRKEFITPPGLVNRLKELGIQEIELTEEEFFFAVEVASKYVKLSGYDRVALAIAKFRQIPLLTGDNALRKAAQREKVQVIGTIGLLDRLFKGGYIEKMEYKECLEQLLIHKERRLPEEELKARLRQVSIFI